MGRYTGPKNKIARRFGINIGLKSNPAKVARRLTKKPGMHGDKRKGATSTFGKQLEEKQKAKFIYGIREQQLTRYVREAERRAGNSGVSLQEILECRLDNVVYRMGFAITRAQARQFVGHNMFTVNGKKMNIPSYQVKSGDVIALKANKAKKVIFTTISDTLAQATLPSWITVDAAKKEGKILHMPKMADFDKIFDVTLIIEYYATR